jgi:hypothetical protein
MKKLLFILPVIALAIMGCSGEEVGLNSFSEVSVSATTTSATNNIKLLNTNTRRRYALVINDSDTTIYLYPGYFADTSAASTTLMANQGIRLNANGGSFEIEETNLYIGQLWLATTTADKKVLVIEK